MADPLAVVWERIDLPSPLIDGDEVLRLGEGVLDRLVATGLVRETGAAASVVCDACDLGHVEDVVFVDTPADAGVRAYIRCPENGRVRVPIDRLRQWEVDLSGIARAVARALAGGSAAPGIAEIAPSRIWFLGKAHLAGRSRELFLARGIHLHDGAEALKKASRLRASRTAVVFVPDAAPPPEIWGPAQPPVISLSTMLSLQPSGLVVDQAHVEAVLNPEIRVSADARKDAVANALVRPCSGRMRWLDLDEGAYNKLVGTADDFDVFADGLKRTVAKTSGKKRVRKTGILASYFLTIRAAIEKRANYDPGVEGPQGDTDSGKQIFQRARRLLDIETSKRKWALFKTDMTDFHAVYRFDPDPAVSFAFVFVPKA